MRFEHRTFRRASVVLATAVAVLAMPTSAVSGTLAGATPPEQAGLEPLVLDGLSAGTYEVTLITGDKVTIRGAGRGHTVTVTGPAPRPDGSDPTFTTQSSEDGVYVIPSDAQPAVSAGALDRELFNVEYLATHGLTDGESTRLPLIVQYADGRRADGLRSRAEAMPASAPTATLPSIDGAAVTVPKARAEDFWGAVRKPAADPQRQPAAALRQHVEQIWLDRVLTVRLDESVPLIGAPQAWAGGHDGTGVTVAVLDTGIDAAHPDLQGKVVATRSFVSDTVNDGAGHGTHVASTIAGSGAASGGRYKGVAPGADLAIGKVCDDQGQCPTSAVIDGMEWAAQQQDADIVSLSLGGDPTDGSDPESQAVDQLTAGTGALFVIAAGNDGPGSETVTTPGAADAALTVAATDKSDRLAGFSSRGPRLDGALKPDIAAPGVSIVAARAAGTSMPGAVHVGEHYTTVSGTSMATPHVSGAAAILAQQHPGWEAARLKAVLMSTSRDAGHTAYEQGAGRVDVTRAVTQQMYATTANLSFGRVDGDTPPLSRQVSYSNHTGRPVTLTLTPALRTIQGEPAAPDALSVDESVTVPAGGTESTTVTLDPAALAEGTYAGALVATDAATGVELRTPIGADARTFYRLRVHVIGLHGEPRGAQVTVSAVDVPGEGYVPATPAGPGISRALVPAGTYSVSAAYRQTDAITSRELWLQLMDPQIDVTADTDIYLDARETREISISTPRPAVPHTLGISYQRSAHDDNVRVETSGTPIFAQSQVRVTPTERATTGLFRFATQWTLANPALAMDASGERDVQLHPLLRAHADRGLAFDPARPGDALGHDVGRSDGWVPLTRDGRFELVDAGLGRAEDIAGLDLRGKLALMQYGRDDPSGDGIPDSVIYLKRLNNLHDAGAVGAIVFSNPPDEWAEDLMYAGPQPPFPFDEADLARGVDIPDVQLPRDEGRRLLDMLAAGPVEVEVASDHNIRYSYHLALVEDQQVDASQDHRFSSDNLAQVDASYHSERAIGAASTEQSWLPGGSPMAGSLFRFAVPQRRTQYFGPVDPALVRRGTVEYFDSAGLQQHLEEAQRVFDTPRSTERWRAAPVAPGAFVVLGEQLVPFARSPYRDCTLCREGALLLPFTHDITGDHHAVAPRSSLVALSTADGQQIPLDSEDGTPVFRLPEQQQQYQFVEQKENPDTTTRWTFTSGAPGAATARPGTVCWLGLFFGHGPCHPESAVFLRYDLGEALRLDNTVPAQGAHKFTVTAYNGQSTEPMPRIQGLRLWTSTNGGQSWREARVTADREGAGERRFRVTAVYPGSARSDGSVSLKAKAWDAAGNRVEQVMLDAFDLRRRGPD